MKSSGARHIGREYALRMLYTYDIDAESRDTGGHLPPANWWGSQDRLHVTIPAEEFANKLVKTIRSHYEDIDSLIREYSHHWRLPRMAPVDRNILRIGVSELLYHKNTPTKVILNEALELAKCYGDADSPRFINGILDPLAGKLRAEEDRDSRTS
ncbi:MAG: transcription antitermination factor NusB [Candidatus Omnitrophota bacterium]|jgi:N utilization substance protein B|nr:MAG: transcription antitermination factor NusB [Candidatus Omnitrophota bacterium]